MPTLRKHIATKRAKDLGISKARLGTALKFNNRESFYKHFKKDDIDAEQYLRDNAYRLSVKTIKTYNVTNKAFHAFLKNPYLYKITEQDVLNYLNSRTKSMARKDLISLKAMFSYARKFGVVRKSPAANIPIPKLKRNFPLIFTKAEFQKFIGYVTDGDTRDLFTVAVYTGLRLNELTALTPANIQGNYIVITSLKSGRVRSVPMNEAVKNIVDRRLGSSFVFAYKSIQWKERRVQVQFKKYLKLSGLNPKLHFHCFRHSFATWLIQSGVNILYVKELLGHSSLQTTLIYTHCFRTDLEDAIRLL